MCQECAVGSYTSTEQQTACDECLAGSFLVAQDATCQQCSPGTFRSMLMNTCSPCDAGRSSKHQVSQGCHQCSAVLDPEGPNLHLWTTMRSIENAEWMEISGSHSLSDCGCAVGAWLDAFGQCQECGVGIACKGMGEVDVLPGYFARADSPGFVWRCHGADWARCPGGRPGTCAQHRLNTSTACEECEPYTRSTNDGPCKAVNAAVAVICANAFAFVVLTLCMVACHFLNVVVFHCSVLLARCSMLCTSRSVPPLYSPLQCNVHSNGQNTLQAHRQVICWDCEGNHRYMIIIGALASLIPLAFFSLCAWVTLALPKRLRKGDTVFLNTFAFLLFRFRPGAENYVLVVHLRNFALAVVPVIADLAFELFASAAVVMTCVLLGVSMSPWAVRQANHLDVAMHTGLLLVLLFSRQTVSTMRQLGTCCLQSSQE